MLTDRIPPLPAERHFVIQHPPGVPHQIVAVVHCATGEVYAQEAADLTQPGSLRQALLHVAARFTGQRACPPPQSDAH
jgi:hypothetical protein